MGGLSVREAAERSRRLYAKGYTMGVQNMTRGFSSREAKEMAATVRPLSMDIALATTMYDELTPAAKAAVDAELAESVRQLRKYRVRNEAKGADVSGAAILGADFDD